MKTVLHTFGVAQAIDAARRLQFTHVIAPMTVARPEQDAMTAADCAAAGMSVLFDMSAHKTAVQSAAFAEAVKKWARALKGSVGVAGVWVSDINVAPDGVYTWTGALDGALGGGLQAYASTSARMIDAIGEISTRVTALAYPMYRHWGGDGRTAEDPATAFGTVASAWGAFKTLAPAPMKRWVGLQGFYDRQWAAHPANVAPSYTQLKAVYDGVLAADADVDGIVVFGLAASPGTQARYRGLMYERSLYDAVGLMCAKARGRLFVAPAQAMVRVRESVDLTASATDAVWALVRAPAGCSIALNGVLTAGDATGEAVVSATRTGEYAESRVIVYREK